jgi:hypothetical protein
MVNEDISPFSQRNINRRVARASMNVLWSLLGEEQKSHHQSITDIMISQDAAMMPYIKTLPPQNFHVFAKLLFHVSINKIFLCLDHPFGANRMLYLYLRCVVLHAQSTGTTGRQRGPHGALRLKRIQTRRMLQLAMVIVWAFNVQRSMFSSTGGTDQRRNQILMRRHRH